MERLHIGGEQPRDGWKILNIQPGRGVEFVGNIRDLTGFADHSWDEIYASHVLEHIPMEGMVPALQGIFRILRPGGKLMLSVPDLETLCSLFVHPQLGKLERFHIMKMIYGGQCDAHDFHYIGLNFEFLSDYLVAVGFSEIERVPSFGLFDDTSDFAPYGIPISLNVVAYKAV